MQQKILRLALLIGLFPAISTANITTSPLNNTKPTSNKPLPTKCEQMFSSADKLISDAEKQPGTHTQVNKMKSKLSSTKQKILKMDSELQIKSCEKGLIALNTLRQKHQ